MKRFLLYLSLVAISYNGYSQCDPMSSIEEDFDTWTSIDQCWRTYAGSSMLYPDSGAITFYSFFTANANLTLVTPEINELDGTQTLSFTASGSAEGISIEIGTLTDNDDINTFTAFGSSISLTTTTTNYSVSIPSSSASYIGIRAIIPPMHGAVALDNLELTSTLSLIEQKSGYNYSIYPNPVSNLLYSRINQEDVKEIEVYDFSGRLVVKTNQFPVAFSQFNNGVYLVKVSTAEQETNFKVVKR